jgi:hypothetical protein
MSEALASIPLPQPVDDRNASIFAAVAHPDAVRSVRVTPLAPQLLSNILWSAWGANRRPGSAPRRDIDLFLLCDKAAYHYNARANHLLPLAANEDGAVGGASGVPAKSTITTVQLIYVISLPQGGVHDSHELPQPQMQGGYYCADTGPVAGKIYLFASAHGISAAPQSCDHAHLARRLGLSAEQRVLFAQTIRCPR